MAIIMPAKHQHVPIVILSKLACWCLHADVSMRLKTPLKLSFTEQLSWL